MSFDILHKSEMDSIKKRALCADFGKIDSMLTERWVPVHLVNDGPFPAWSDGEAITFVSKYLDLGTVEDIIAANGLNYHELSHLLYTPRHRHPVQKWIASVKPRRLVFNMLEDSRIERLFTNKYAATKPYFLNTVVKYILSQQGLDAKDEAMLHLLCHARRYIPADIRQEFRRKFRQEFGRTEEKSVTDTIEKYVRCNPDKDSNEMISCIQAILDFLERNQNPSLPDKDHNGQEDTPSTRPDRGQSRPATKQEKDINNANDQEDGEGEDGSGGGSDQESDGDDQSEGGQSDGSSDDGSEDSEDHSDGQGDDSDGDDSEGNSTSGDRDGDSDSTEESGGQSAGRGSASLSPGKLKERLQETLEEVQTNPEVQKDVANTQRLLREGKNASRAPSLAEQRTYKVAPDEMHILASKRLAREFSKIVEDSDPGMKTYQSSGKVNMKRAMMQGDPDTVYDLWDEGQVDSADFELVLMVDRSGSMNHRQEGANQAAWSILRGVDMLGGRAKSTYLAFESDCTIIKNRDQRVGPDYWNFSSAGGTYPLKALQEAAAVFQTSDKSRGALIVLTDGVWDQSGHCDPLIKRMGDAGVVTALAGMYGAAAHFQMPQHEAQVYQRISSPEELIPFAKEIVKQVMKTTIRR